MFRENQIFLVSYLFDCRKGRGERGGGDERGGGGWKDIFVSI